MESEKYVYSSFKVESSVEKDLAGYMSKSETDTNKKEGETLLGSVTEDISTIKTFITAPNPFILVKAFDFLFSLLDALAYTFVIIIRFAFLFILRFLGPFALAFSIYHRFENWWVNWMKAYGMLYLWVMVIFLINFFATGIAHGVYKVSYAMGQGEGMAFMAYNSAMWCLVLVKLYLYFKSKKCFIKYLPDGKQCFERILEHRTQYPAQQPHGIVPDRAYGSHGYHICRYPLQDRYLLCLQSPYPGAGWIYSQVIGDIRQGIASD
ncbi:MAG: hypothetical protein HC831_04050 [Chloroflexia bacterium]|nr:hypothetical protein [Chloroflexia bacterium]